MGIGKWDCTFNDGGGEESVLKRPGPGKDGEIRGWLT